MRHEQTLNIRQGAQLALTTRLQQAIALLQLSTVELNQFIQDQCMENPLLSLQDDGCESDKETNLNVPDESASEWYYTESDGHIYSKTTSLSNFDSDNQMPLWRATLTLHDYISSQIRLKFSSKDDQIIAMEIMAQLNEDGLLEFNWRDELSIPKNIVYNDLDIDRILKVLQTLEPSGIFACSIIETLQLQLYAQYQQGLSPWDLDSIVLMLKAFQSLKTKPFDRVCKMFNIDSEDFQLFLVSLKQLQFRPSSAFDTNDTIVGIMPEVVVQKMRDGDITVRLNSATLPKVVINSEYYNELKKCVKKADELSYLREKFTKANWLMQALEKRTVTLLQVTAEIVQWQKDFLLGGEMRPMTLKDIALAAGVHESTVSRITTAKYIETPRGVFELKIFFVNIVGEQDGGSSSLEIQNAIRELLIDESKSRPLSDEDLVALLASKGMNVARRTVAKYRMLLGIGSSAERKRQYKMFHKACTKETFSKNIV